MNGFLFLLFVTLFVSRNISLKNIGDCFIFFSTWDFACSFAWNSSTNIWHSDFFSATVQINDAVQWGVRPRLRLLYFSACSLYISSIVKFFLPATVRRFDFTVQKNISKYYLNFKLHLREMRIKPTSFSKSWDLSVDYNQIPLPAKRYISGYL